MSDVFFIPSEFLGGHILSDSGLAKPLQVVVDPTLALDHHFDPSSGVFSIREDVYTKKRGVELEALFRIPNLRFASGWSSPDGARVPARSRAFEPKRDKIGARSQIASEVWGELGIVSLQDSPVNRLLLSGEVYGGLPSQLWEGIPLGIRLLYEREGVDVHFENIDSLTDEVMDELACRLPGLMIKGFLNRVMNPAKPEDVRSLAEEYFFPSYGLANEGRLGAQVLEDAPKIVTGLGRVDFAKYADPRMLGKLLTLIPFIPDPRKIGQRLSLRDLYMWIHHSIPAGRADEVFKQSGCRLSPQILKRLKSVIASDGSGSDTRAEIVGLAASEFSGEALLNLEWPIDRVEDPAWKLYFRWFSGLVRHYFAGRVDHILSTREDLLFADAAYQHVDGRHRFLMFFGDTLERHVHAFVRGLRDPREFRAELMLGIDTVTHELAHLLHRKTEAVDVTHDTTFFDQQMTILLTRGRRPMAVEKMRMRYLNDAIKGGIDLNGPIATWKDVLRGLGVKRGMRKNFGPIAAGHARSVALGNRFVR